MQSQLNLNDDAVYYGNEASKQYMSVSQFKGFLSCEARMAAKLKEEWRESVDSQALLIGNYVHSYFESEQAHAEFINVNKDKLYSKRKPFGLLKAYEQADAMIEKLNKEPLFNYLWQGERETVVTGTFEGVEWKGKIDLLNVDKGYFIDLKTTADMNKRIYSEYYGGYVSFVEAYGYVLQIAVYEKLLEMKYGKPFVGYIYAISKHDYPQVAAIEIEQHKKDMELNWLHERMPHIIEVKNGNEPPINCGKCDYCKATQKLDGFITTEDLIG